MTHILIDGNNMVYRIRYGIGDQPNLRETIVSTFINSLSFFLSPDVETVTVCFDNGIPKKRKDLLPSYKENRTATDEHRAIYSAINRLEQILPRVRVNVFCRYGYEADDLMNGLAKVLPGDVMIISSDRDMYQCLSKDGRIIVYNPTRKKKIFWESITNSYGITPDRWSDFRALMGDSSDGIPGVKGIGEVYASQILAVFDNVYDLVRYLGSGITSEEWVETTGLPERFYHMLVAENNAILTYEKVINLTNTESEVTHAIYNVGVDFYTETTITDIEAIAIELGCYELIAESYRFAELAYVMDILHER